MAVKSKSKGATRAEKPSEQKASATSWGLTVAELTMTITFILYISSRIVGDYCFTYLQPRVEALRSSLDYPKWNSYYYRTCTEKDATATETSQILLGEQDTPQDAKDKALTHGATIFPSALSSDVAQKLGDSLNERAVPHGEARFVSVHENQVSEALHQLFHNTLLRESIDEIIGYDPAVLEIKHFASSNLEDHLHADVPPTQNAIFDVRSHVHTYSLLIPLQDTPTSKGSFSICPGSHVCSLGQNLFCRDSSVDLFGDSVWKAGDALLYNSALTYRQLPAQRLQDASSFLKISLAGRPNSKHETRFVPDHFFGPWWQWGHTVSDFADAEVTMRWPFATLKSLGLFKVDKQNWGWDFVQLLVTRVVQQEARALLFLETLVPGSILRNDAAAYLESLFETARKVEKFSLGLFVALFVLVASLLASGKQRVAQILQNVLNLIVSHALIATLLLELYRRGSLNRSHVVQTRSSGIHSTLNLPKTLPITHDVLIDDEYSVAYLAGHREILAKAHPGNTRFRHFVALNSVNYDILPASLQHSVTESIRYWMLQEQGRFLVKNARDWADAPDDVCQPYIHESLLSAANPLYGVVLEALNSLAEKQIGGVDAHSTMIRLHSMFHFTDIRSRLAKYVYEDALKSRFVAARSFQQQSHLRVKSILPDFKRSSGVFIEELSGIPFPKAIVEPYTGAWAEVGSFVESNFDEVSDDYMVSIIRHADSSSSSWKVQYADGEVNVGLCRRCIRAFYPFQVGEEVKFGTYEDYEIGRIVAINEDETVDLVSVEDGESPSRVHMAYIFRFLDYTVPLRTKIHVITNADDDVTRNGRIEHVFANGTVLVAYDDGELVDVESSLLDLDPTWFEDILDYMTVKNSL